jgi:hypothetical protein
MQSNVGDLVERAVLVHSKQLFPCAHNQLWQALINGAELAELGAMLRLVLSREKCESVAQITRYESSRLLECRCAGKLLRWRIEPQGKSTTLVTFTCTLETLACLDES